MSAVAKAVGTVSGILSAVFSLAGNPVLAGAFAANAALMGVVSKATANKPPAQGSSTMIRIGANQPMPYMIGRAYSGGCRVHQVGYGESDDIPNVFALFVDVYSCGGPLHAHIADYADFEPLTFTGSNANGYFHNNLHRFYQMGATPESSALATHWADPADWGAAYKLSGLAAEAWNAGWPEEGDIFASGFPQTGVEWEGVLNYDARQDSTYPGGSGSQRWADPADKVAFAAAKPTWGYNRCPGLHGLRYALGIWERDETDTDAPYVQVFGMGLPWDGIVVEDFVELANVCDANGWTVNGTIYESGAPGECWANLKRILAAGGARPVFKGAKLGVMMSAPRVSLDTITRDDLAGAVAVPAMKSWRSRPNTLIPEVVDPDQKWEFGQSNPVQVLDYVEADGGERPDVAHYDLVTNYDQGAQLAAYELIDGREQGPIPVPLKPRFRRYRIDSRLTLSDELQAEWALLTPEVRVIGHSVDPKTMTVTLTLVTETNDKHAFALAQTGTSPPALSITTAETADGALGGARTTSLAIRNATVIVGAGDDLLTAEDDAGDGKITIADHSWDYPNGTSTSRTAGVLTGLDLATRYYVYFDDATLTNAAPTYAVTTVHVDSLNSSSNPYRHHLGYVDVPGSGDPPTTGGGGGGGGCPCGGMYLLTRDRDAQRVDAITVDDHVWGRHEITGMWGWYRVVAIEALEQPCVAFDHKAATFETSESHLNDRSGAWRMSKSMPGAAEIGMRTVYATTVENAHTYWLMAAPIGPGLLAHNKTVSDD